MKRNFAFVIPVIILISSLLKAQTGGPEEWVTYFEKSSFLETPRYNETMSYFRKFEAVSPFAKMITFGISPQGRELNCLVVARNGEFTPQAAQRSQKAVILIESGIHAGEIEGKDACMMLLRDILITKQRQHLLDNLIIMIIPIFNVDGHERISEYNRINQNGPKEMGWRTTSQNLNLNRDFMKADAPEMQAFLKLYNEWLPDFFIDSHTTDGADYQYTVTYGVEKFQAMNKETAVWLKDIFVPYMKDAVEKKGYLVAPYLNFVDDDITKGVTDGAASPRFSTGYAEVQNRPSLLIETHMLKPYKDRVFSTMEVISSSLEYFNNKSLALKALNKRADENAVKQYAEGKEYLPLSYKLLSQADTMLFKGIRAVNDSSWIAGKRIPRYTGEKIEFKIPFFNHLEVEDSVNAPNAYLIPKQYSQIIDRIRLHGISVDELKKDTTLEVERYKFNNVRFAERPYEGRFQPSYDIITYKVKVSVPKGTYVIYSNQRTVRVIINLLEPRAPDSFIKWGFFNTIFEQKEYFEDYAMEPAAEKMISRDPKLKEDFIMKLNADEAFRKSPRQRLNFFYERSEFYDRELNVYPVMRVMKRN